MSGAVVAGPRWPRVVFLDVDGVLNHPGTYADRGRWARPRQRQLEVPTAPECVARLNEIVRRTGAVVVISSSWRKFARFDSLGPALLRRGVVAEIVGETPDLSRDEALAARIAPGRVQRGHEIDAWLRDHQIDGGRPAYVILDDCDDMAHLAGCLVQTDPVTGLDEADVAIAVAVLTGVRPPTLADVFGFGKGPTIPVGPPGQIGQLFSEVGAVDRRAATLALLDATAGPASAGPARSGAVGWTTQRISDHWRAEIRARFEAQNAAFRAKDEAGIARLSAGQRAERVAIPHLAVGDSSIWEIYQATDVSVDDSRARVVLPIGCGPVIGWTPTIDVLSMFDGARVSWSRAFVSAEVVYGAPRVVLTIFLVDYWDDELDRGRQQEVGGS